MRKTFDNSRLDIIVPMKMEADWPTKEDLVEAMRYQKEHYGIHRFALGAPSIGWKSAGFPPLSHFERLGRFFAEIRDEVRKDGISCGFMNMLTIRNGSDARFTNILRADGTEAELAPCPLDPAFQQVFSESNALLVKLARPDFVFFEDEYTVCAQTRDRLGCFCEHHLRAFADRCGRYYTREELVSIFAENTPEALALLRTWRELTRDSLVSLSQAVRREVDKYTPEVPMGTMQPASCDRDGDSTEAVARALAGPNHTPFSRIYGTIYCDIANAKNIPEILYHALHTRQHIQGDFCFYHESDTYPHTRYFISAVKMRAFMAAAFSMGFDGATHQTVQILDDKNEERAYGLMYKKECARYNAMSRIAKQCTVKGVEIAYDPFYNLAEPGSARPHWTRCVAIFGIPYATVESEVAFWDRRQAKYADGETVLRYLSKGLFLDAAAAKILVERGYGKYIGVEIGEDLVEGVLRNDDAAREIIQQPFDRISRGTHMWTANQCAANRGGKVMEMIVTDPGVEVITQLVTFQNQHVCPAMVRFENELGGRIVVLGMTLEKNVSSSLFHYRRQRLFRELIRWCSDSYVLTMEEPNVYTVMNEAAEPEKSGFIGMLTLTNLGEDPIENAVLHLPPKWASANRFKLLDRNGEWVEVDWARTETSLTIREPLCHCDPVCILAE